MTSKMKPSDGIITGDASIGDSEKKGKHLSAPSNPHTGDNIAIPQLKETDIRVSSDGANIQPTDCASKLETPEVTGGLKSKLTSDESGPIELLAASAARTDLVSVTESEIPPVPSSLSSAQSSTMNLHIISEDKIDLDMDSGEDDNDDFRKCISIDLTPLKHVASATKKKKKQKKKKLISICTSCCRYESVRRVSKHLGMKEVGEDDEWTIYWTDYSVTLDRVMEMKRFQKINHFPGMNEICRKDFLARNLNRLQKLFPKEYCCFPKTWCLPADYNDFQAYCRAKKNKTFICKPETGCQGKGIFITKNLKDIKHGEHMICQQYITKCLLIDGFKFDFRLYVLVTSCDPLRIFMYKEGLGRFATKKYQEPTSGNMDEVCMHLTNYAINKNSDDFVRDDECGSKRRLATVCNWLDENGYDVDLMWENIEDVVIKTLISAHPILKHNYRTCFPNHISGSACFEILGFDVMLDRKLKAWVLEVNHSPSFHTDAPLDKEVKEGLLHDTFNLLDLRTTDKRKCIEEDKRRIKERLTNKPKSREARLEEQKATQQSYMAALEKHEAANMGGFRRIYPRPGDEKYARYFENSCSLFQTTAAAKAREECARALLEELRLKHEREEMMIKGRPRNNAGEAGGEKKTPRPRHRMTSKQRGYPTKKPQSTLLPTVINDAEELERISGMLQRDSLMRNMGIVDLVHRLLSHTPGTMGISKTAYPQDENREATSQSKGGNMQHLGAGVGDMQVVPKLGLKPSHYFTITTPSLKQQMQQDYEKMKQQVEKQNQQRQVALASRHSDNNNNNTSIPPLVPLSSQHQQRHHFPFYPSRPPLHVEPLYHHHHHKKQPQQLEPPPRHVLSGSGAAHQRFLMSPSSHGGHHGVMTRSPAAAHGLMDRRSSRTRSNDVIHGNCIIHASSGVNHKSPGKMVIPARGAGRMAGPVAALDSSNWPNIQGAAIRVCRVIK